MSAPFKIKEGMLEISSVELDSHITYGGLLFNMYCLCYRFKYEDTEKWTGIIGKCKACDKEYLKPTLQLYQEKCSFLKDHIVYPAIGIGAIRANKKLLESGDPVYIIGECLSKFLEVSWEPMIIHKRPHRRLQDIRDADKRDKEVCNAYRTENIPEDVNTVVIYDDVCTRGATIKSIVRCIRGTNRKRRIRFIALALAKAENREYHAMMGRYLTNDHLKESVEYWDALYGANN